MFNRINKKEYLNLIELDECRVKINKRANTLINVI